MKDYILENRDLIGQREILQLSMETANNKIEINKINSDMISLEKQISDVAEGLKDVVTKSELADMMNSFVSDDDGKWLIQDMEIVGEYSDEGHSGKNIKGRQEFMRMLNDIEDVKDGVDFVLVFKLSRFGRNVADVFSSLQLMKIYQIYRDDWMLNVIE